MLFFGRRLLNKPLKKQSNFSHDYDQTEYLRAMKEFQLRTRGVRKGSAEFESIRNEIYSKLREDKSRAKAEARAAAGGAAHVIANDCKVNYDSSYSLLIVVPEEVASHECVNILSYYGFPVNIEEDNLARQIIKTEMEFDKEDPYQCLMIELSDVGIPRVDLASSQAVLSFIRYCSINNMV